MHITIIIIREDALLSKGTSNVETASQDHYIYITFNHLADAFIQGDVQMRRTIEAIRPSREQQYTSAMTSLS